MEKRYYPMRKCRLCGEIYEDNNPPVFCSDGFDKKEATDYTVRWTDGDRFWVELHECKDGSIGTTDFIGFKIMPKHKVKWGYADKEEEE